MNEDSRESYERIKKLIDCSPNKEVVIWVISCEDVYETAFGDGKYVYEEKACLTYKVASSWTKWINERPKDGQAFFGYLATVNPKVLRLGLGGNIMYSKPTLEGNFKEFPYLPLDHLNEKPSGWESIVEWYCKHGKTRPDWKDVWE
jgi:hypothetical protein